MNNLALRRSFVLLHVVLGAVICVESVSTLFKVTEGHPTNPLSSHLALLAAVEALAAICF